MPERRELAPLFEQAMRSALEDPRHVMPRTFHDAYQQISLARAGRIQATRTLSADIHIPNLDLTTMSPLTAWLHGFASGARAAEERGEADELTTLRSNQEKLERELAFYQEFAPHIFLLGADPPPPTSRGWTAFYLPTDPQRILQPAGSLEISSSSPQLAIPQLGERKGSFVRRSDKEAATNILVYLTDSPNYPIELIFPDGNDKARKHMLRRPQENDEGLDTRIVVVTNPGIGTWYHLQITRKEGKKGIVEVSLLLPIEATTSGWPNTS